MNYQNIKLDKSMYKAGVPFLAQLEKLDPSANYAGGELAGLDAFQRQLKRFDIKVSGAGSDSISKFFGTGDSAALFPEYVTRAVMQGADETAAINSIIASKTVINSLDYRTITTDTGHDTAASVVAEGGQIPETVIKLKDNLVKLIKRGRMLVASYEAVKFQRIDLFTVTLKQIGAYITKAQLKDAIDVLIDGDANNNAAEVIETAAAGTLTYDDLLRLWSKFEDFQMNTMIVSPDMMQKLLTLSELRDPVAGLNFNGGFPLTALQFGTFLFEHNPRKIELSFSNNVAAHILPAHGTISQNIGPRCRVVRCEGEVFASTPEGASANLSAIGAVCSGAGATLYLPTGERFAAIVSRFGYSAQGDGRVISYSIEFIEQSSAGAGASI